MNDRSSSQSNAPARRVLIHSHLAFEFPNELTKFTRYAPGATVEVAEDEEAFLDRIGDAEVIVTGPVDRDVLESAKKVKLHVVPFAGVNRAPLAWYADHGVLLASSHGNAQAVAERAVALAFAAAGRVAEFDRDLRAGRWHRRRDERQPFDYWRSLTGSRIAILGTGAIGSRIATLLQPVAEELRGFRRRAPESVTESPAGTQNIVTGEDPDALEEPRRHPTELFDRLETNLEAAIAGVDLVIVALPLTESTRGVVTYDLLQSGNNAVLVNVSRAEIIPEDDLYTALTDGTLYAAGLDVWYRYPSPFWNEGPAELPSKLPFHTLDNVVLSPHAGSHSRAGKRGQLIGALAHVEEYFKTGAVRDAVDTKKGY